MIRRLAVNEILHFVLSNRALLLVPAVGFMLSVVVLRIKKR